MRGQIFDQRSVIEGVTFALADAAAIMRDLDLDISAVRTTGGGARSALWQQIQADILKSRVRTAHADGGPAFGAALIAGVGVGALPSLQEATERFVTIRSETEPNPDTSSVYARYHRVFDRLYPVLRAEFREAARLLEDGPATE